MFARWGKGRALLVLGTVCAKAGGEGSGVPGMAGDQECLEEVVDGPWRSRSGPARALTARIRS